MNKNDWKKNIRLSDSALKVCQRETTIKATILNMFEELFESKSIQLRHASYICIILRTMNKNTEFHVYAMLNESNKTLYKTCNMLIHDRLLTNRMFWGWRECIVLIFTQFPIPDNEFYLAAFKCGKLKTQLIPSKECLMGFFAISIIQLINK